jgi:hypothetical protein
MIPDVSLEVRSLYHLPYRGDQITVPYMLYRTTTHRGLTDLLLRSGEILALTARIRWMTGSIEKLNQNQKDGVGERR